MHLCIIRTFNKQRQTIDWTDIWTNNNNNTLIGLNNGNSNGNLIKCYGCNYQTNNCHTLGHSNKARILHLIAKYDCLAINRQAKQFPNEINHMSLYFFLFFFFFGLCKFKAYLRKLCGMFCFIFIISQLFLLYSRWILLSSLMLLFWSCVYTSCMYMVMCGWYTLHLILYFNFLHLFPFMS